MDFHDKLYPKPERVEILEKQNIRNCFVIDHQSEIFRV